MAEVYRPPRAPGADHVFVQPVQSCSCCRSCCPRGHVLEFCGRQGSPILRRLEIGTVGGDAEHRPWLGSEHASCARPCGWTGRARGGSRCARSPRCLALFDRPGENVGPAVASQSGRLPVQGAAAGRRSVARDAVQGQIFFAPGAKKIRFLATLAAPF